MQDITLVNAKSLIDQTPDEWKAFVKYAIADTIQPCFGDVVIVPYTEQLETIVAFIHGLNHKVPPSLCTMYSEFERTNDPQYTLYLSLRSKFEGA